MATETKYFTKKGDPRINFDLVSQEALDKLTLAREISGIPYKITSTYRTKEQDIALAGFAGAHTETPCTAFDIAFKNSKDLFLILKGLFTAGFIRIGVNWNNNHIHVDDSKKLPNPVFFKE